MRVVRGCGYITNERTIDGQCTRRTGTHDVVAHYCACTEDLCNSSSEKLPWLGMIEAIGLIVAYSRM